MILYTPLSREDIFPADEERHQRKFISYEGKTLCVEQLENGSYSLVQLLSTNPQDYLDPTLMPGSILPHFDNQSTNYHH